MVWYHSGHTFLNFSTIPEVYPAQFRRNQWKRFRRSGSQPLIIFLAICRSLALGPLEGDPIESLDD